MSKRLKITLVVVGALVVLGGGAAAYSSRNRGVVPVIAAKVETQDIVAKVTANGKIQAENRVELSALVMGQIVNLRVKEGDRVKKGDFLLQIDRNRAAADEAGSAAALLASGNDRDSAKTAMEQAERDFQRTRANYEGKIASESDFEKARSTPDGATISDMSIVQAVLMVDETDTPTVQVGQKALLTRLPPEPGGTKCGPSAYAEELLALGAQRGRSISQMLPVVSAYS
jgi:multidrug efflux pump subunit AcrA (membrane-fusion protein)